MPEQYARYAALPACRYDPTDMAADPGKLSFDRFVLDLNRGSLLRDGHEVPLRPKTFAVLQFLVMHAGRLVSKDELLAAVWPNLVVTDDTLVQSIGELRRALGAEAAKLITTVPRRGYRFETPASHAERRGRSNLLRWRWTFGVLVPLAIPLVLVALWAWLRVAPPGAAPRGERPTVAVLPFLHQGDDPAREYLADGLTQDVIYSLGRFRELTVMSWNAVAGYKGVARPGSIARVLNVRYQVEGSVRYAADRVRVIAQLVDERGRVLWSATFEEASTQVFALQDRVAREIAGALAIRVGQFEQQRVATQPTTSFAAYEYVLRARPALRRPTRAGIVEARALLRSALAQDPAYAAAHSTLADTFHAAISMGWAESPGEYWNQVEREAREALRLDDEDVRAHILLARWHSSYNRFAEAEREIERAVAINPSDAQALAGRGNILVWLGKTRIAIESLELAQHLDPELNAFDRFALSLAYYLEQRYRESIEQSQLNLHANSSANFNRVVLAAAYAELGRDADAARIAQELARTDPTFDAESFGSKFQNPSDLARLRAGMRKAGLYRSAD